MSADRAHAPHGLGLASWAGGVLLLLVLALTAAALLPHAKLEPDDYRYVWHLQQVERGAPGALARAVVVENRWDDHWWIDDGTYVRFLRPFSSLTYALDQALFGHDPRGAVLANVLLHALVVLVGHAVLRRVLGSGWAALLAALVFAMQTCHVEQLYFVAGKSDTLAGFFALSALLVFLRGRERAAWPWHAALAALYLAALLSKESQAVLPLFFLALERWVPGSPGSSSWRAILRRRAALLVLLAAVLLAYLGVRALLLGEAGSGVRPYPYFFLPGRDGFALRTLAVWLMYCTSFVTGVEVIMFLTDAAALVAAVPWPLLAAGALGMPALLAFGVRSPRGRFFACLLLVPLVPSLVLYSSGRYVYVASFAWCGLVGLAAAALARRHAALAVAFALCALVPQAVLQQRAIARLPLAADPRNPAEIALGLLREGELDLRSPAPIYLIDMPLRWIELQFLQHMAEVAIEPRSPPIRTLVRSPRTQEQGLARVRVVDAHTLEIERPNGRLYEPDPVFDFDQRRVQPGDVIHEQGYTVEVLAVQGAHARAIRVRFDAPLAELQLGVCRPRPGGWRIERLAP